MFLTYVHRLWNLHTSLQKQYSKLLRSFSYFPILASWHCKGTLIIISFDNLTFFIDNHHCFKSSLISHFCYRFLMQMYAVWKYVVQFCNTNFRKCPFIWFMSKNRKILWQLRIYADSNLELFFHSLLIYNTIHYKIIKISFLVHYHQHSNLHWFSFSPKKCKLR